ncbi:hypothetical protein C8Q74DRAFT_677944 [Fomes fomentarius]|nr:hypothetical protein C8Q74DRAFT_677944 [Fomes fomentarius]
MLYQSTPLRHGMDTSHLPIEICEHVIDACYEDPDKYWLHGTSYQTWCQTAVVCYDWLPRSQLSLCCDIEICSVSQLDLVLRTLSDALHLADLVFGVKITPVKRVYMGLPRLLNPQLLRNCIRVDLFEIPWEVFPSRYADRILYPWRNRGLTHFSMELEQGSCASILRLLYTLPRLQMLTLTVRRETVHIPENVLAILRDQPCPFPNLRTLELWGGTANMTFPPLLFPDSITDLSLDVEDGISATTMGLLQSLRQLQHLQVTCSMSHGDPPEIATESEAWRIQPLLTFLGSLPAPLSARLPELTIRFDPWVLPDDRGEAYYINRECILDNVLGCRESTDTLRPFSALRLLSVTIYENDRSQHGEKWWRAEIASRLHVHLRAVIDVILFDERAWDLLWCTHTDLSKALGRDGGKDEASPTDIALLSDNDHSAGKDNGDQSNPGAENIPLPPSRSQSPSPAAPSLSSTLSTPS